MKRSLVVLALAGLLAPAAIAVAQGSASGLSVWARAGGGSAADLTGSLLGAPMFAIGTRGGSISLGVGLGLSRATMNEHSEFSGGGFSDDEVRATLWQAGPEIIADVWRSADGRTRGTLSGGVGYGRISVVERFEDSFGGTPSETKQSGSLITLRVGIGGDHWFSPHFALGFEGGIRGTVTRGLKESGSPNTSSFGAAGSYAALRAQVVFGR